MLPLNATPCPQLEQGKQIEPAIEPHSIGSKPIECPYCLHYVNVCMTITRPHPGKSVEFNQQVVWQNAHILVKDMNLEEHYLYVKLMESLAASTSMLYQQRITKERIPDPAALARKSEEFTQAVREQKIANATKKEKRLLTDREKAIETTKKILQAAGLSAEDAEKQATVQIDAQLSKEGRSTGLVN